MLDRIIAPSHKARVNFSVLGSGSAGNSTVIRGSGTHIMVDAGLSGRQLIQRAEAMEVDKIEAVLLTHEHSDHVKGLAVFLKKNPVPVYATGQTAYVLRQAGLVANWQTFEAGQSFTVGAFEVKSFPILHDAVDPVGYVIGHADHKLGILSDAGHVTNAVTQNLRDTHSLFIEANYDDDLLMADTKRPWSIKQRISSRHGHLSNKQVAELIESIAHPALHRVVLGHLSSDCNSAPIAESAVRDVLRKVSLAHVEVCCACQSEARGWWSVR